MSKPSGANKQRLEAWFTLDVWLIASFLLCVRAALALRATLVFAAARGKRPESASGGSAFV